MVKSDVNSSVVKTIARMAMRLRFREAQRVRKLSFRMHFRFLTFILPPPSLPGDDSAVFDADDPVCHLGDFLVVGNHDDGLGEFLAGDLQ